MYYYIHFPLITVFQTDQKPSTLSYPLTASAASKGNITIKRILSFFCHISSSSCQTQRLLSQRSVFLYTHPCYSPYITNCYFQQFQPVVDELWQCCNLTLSSSGLSLADQKLGHVPMSNSIVHIACHGPKDVTQMRHYLQVQGPIKHC